MDSLLSCEMTELQRTGLIDVSPIDSTLIETTWTNLGNSFNNSCQKTTFRNLQLNKTIEIFFFFSLIAKLLLLVISVIFGWYVKLKFYFS